VAAGFAGILFRIPDPQERLEPFRIHLRAFVVDAILFTAQFATMRRVHTGSTAFRFDLPLPF